MGHDRVEEDCAPGNFDEEQLHHISKKRGTQHLEHASNRGERATDEQDHDRCSREDRPERGWSGVEQVHACTDSHEVSRDVERVGDDERSDE